MRKCRPIPELTDRQLRNFWAKIDKCGPDECWEWRGSYFPQGYGRVGLSGDTYGTHRVAYKLLKGEPGRLFVCHTCDNRKCCNPAHLFSGTMTDNMHDMIAKGRDKHGKGEEHSKALLTEKQVKEMRDSNDTLRELALRYNVSSSAVGQARTGVNWPYISGRGKTRKLLPNQVRAIRSLHKQGKTGRELAKQFERSEGLISGIVNQKVWKNV